MSTRIGAAWLVLISIESGERDRCVAMFERLEGSFCCEEFPGDLEDVGAWTPIGFYMGLVHASQRLALGAAMSQRRA